MMGRVAVVLASAALLLAAAWRPAASVSSPAGDPTRLRPVASFTGYADEASLSRAYFLEAGKVIESPRCLNCHPATRTPTQGDDLHPHIPQVTGGADDAGAPGLRCIACHQDRNTAVWGETIRSVPGHRPWKLAPAEMAWQGRTLAQICMQMKDPRRNGGRTLEEIHRHMAFDGLVGWGWSPGEGRRPAPGTQAELGDLVAAWIRTGAVCPG